MGLFAIVIKYNQSEKENAMLLVLILFNFVSKTEFGKENFPRKSLPSKQFTRKHPLRYEDSLIPDL